MRILAIVALALIPAISNAGVTHQVDGKCARGYYKSGSFCKQGAYQASKGQDTIANTAGGRCATGYYKTGGFCRSFSATKDSSVIEQKYGSCPRGHYKSGNFCKKY